MSNWQLLNFTYLKGGSINSDNILLLELKPRYIKTFVNTQTGQYIEVSDLTQKKQKRNNILDLFSSVYQLYYDQKLISMFSMVINEDSKRMITYFFKLFLKRLSKRGIFKLGYVWVRDQGAMRFKDHYHILLATTPMSQEVYNDLFTKKKDRDFEIQVLRNPNGITSYLKEKKLYGAKAKRSFGRSRKFLESHLKQCITKQINGNEQY